MRVGLNPESFSLFVHSLRLHILEPVIIKNLKYSLHMYNYDIHNIMISLC